jgi:hypothetical protein
MASDHTIAQLEYDDAQLPDSIVISVPSDK